MPELPEVQTTVNGINKRVKGLSIQEVWTDYASIHHRGKDNIKDAAFFSFFKKTLTGATITNATRRAKNILIHLSNGHTVLIHMKMTGHMMYGKYKKLEKKDARGEWWLPIDTTGPLADPFNRFIHLVFSFTNGYQLVLSDMRRFAKVTVIKTDELSTSSHLENIGPEPLDENFNFSLFKERLLKKPTGKIKQVLMNHEIVAGIGNIYSDEILWRAGINPLEQVKNIPEKKFKDMYAAVGTTLKKGIDFGGDSMSDYRNIEGEPGKFQEKHNAYRKTGSHCTKPGCKGIIRRIKIGGRSGHYCDVHQKLLK